MLATAPAAQAFNSVASDFFTVGSAGTFTFTYLGHSADDTDSLKFLFNGQTVFINNSDPIGTQVSINVAAAGTYRLSLVDSSLANTWFSDSPLNSDGLEHIKSTLIFSEFGLGALPAVPGNGSPFYGWEDRPFPGSDADFNDLVFTETFTPTPPPH